jgi:hypothetical protein
MKAGCLFLFFFMSYCTAGDLAPEHPLCLILLVPIGRIGEGSLYMDWTRGMRLAHYASAKPLILAPDAQSLTLTNAKIQNEQIQGWSAGISLP